MGFVSRPLAKIEVGWDLKDMRVREKSRIREIFAKRRDCYPWGKVNGLPKLEDAHPGLGVGTGLAISSLMLKIQRFAGGDSVIFALSGRIETENLAQLEALITTDLKRAVLDLKEVNLVSREVVRFLAQCEDNGIKIQNCPAYIREWIARE
jgi:hypothetical protein